MQEVGEIIGANRALTQEMPGFSVEASMRCSAPGSPGRAVAAPDARTYSSSSSASFRMASLTVGASAVGPYTPA